MKNNDTYQIRLCNTWIHYKGRLQTQDIYTKQIGHVNNDTKWQCQVKEVRLKNDIKNTFH